MSYQKEVVEIFDAKWSSMYRQSDELTAASRQHYCTILRDLSTGFGRPISVLDVGCGTGRYFHCLCNVDRLVGTDLSPHMLEQARDPVDREELDVRSLELLCGDIHDLILPTNSFDLICSIGVVGEYSPFDNALLNRLHDLLAPQGILFITAVDIHSRFQSPENKEASLVRRVLGKLFPTMPAYMKRTVNRALSSYFVTEEEVAALLSDSKFARFEIRRYEHTSGWMGTHLDCIAHKA